MNQFNSEENKHITLIVRDCYDSWAESYDTHSNRTRDLDAQITKKILAEIHYGRVLELGCGTGKNTLFLAQNANSFLAMDFSQEMITKARQRNNSKNVSFLRCDLTQTWPCRHNAVELIVCNLVLEHIENLKFIFSEAKRTLVSGGVFYISELHPFRQYEGTNANFMLNGNVVEIPAFIHHISDFLAAARKNSFVLSDLNEWWHPEDSGKPPRILTLLFKKRRKAL